MNDAATAAPQTRPAQPPKDLPKTGGEAVRTFFRHWSPRILLAMFTTALAVRLSLGGWRVWDAVIPLAILAYWPLNEWLIHVFILHRRPRTILGLRIDYPVARKHRQHHANPWNLPLVFIPLHVFPLSVPALLGLAWLITPDWQLAFTFLSFYLLMSLHYEWCHYLAHIGWCPKLEYYQRRVREHRLHHFRNEKFWWGVSMGAADRVLGTAREPGSVPKSDTTHNLGIA